MPRIPLGAVIESALQWVMDHLGSLFEGFSVVLLFAVNAVYGLLAAPPAFLAVAIFGLIVALATRSATMTGFTVLAFLLIDGMQLWTETTQTLAVVIVAAAISIAFGVPLGILAAGSTRTSAVLRPVLDFMQTLPVFVYLVPAVVFFGIGVVPGIMATTVFAIPPAVRLTELGIRQVDGEMVEAAHAFGAGRGQVLREVQLPLAVPSIMAGVNQVIMLALSMVVVAGLVGAAGLGEVVVRGVTTLDIGVAFEGGIAVVILAIFLDRVTGVLGAQRKRSGGTRPRSLLRRAFGPRESSETLEASAAPAAA